MQPQFTQEVEGVFNDYNIEDELYQYHQRKKLYIGGYKQTLMTYNDI